MSETKTSSGSSVRGARRRRKDSDTSRKIKVKYIEFTPEEMAMDCPVDVSDPERYPTITRGDKDWKKFITFRNGFVRLSPEVRKRFKNEKEANAALRKLMEAAPETAVKRKQMVV